jgi:hypothetical protein
VRQVELETARHAHETFIYLSTTPPDVSFHFSLKALQLIMALSKRSLVLLVLAVLNSVDAFAPLCPALVS